MAKTIGSKEVVMPRSPYLKRLLDRIVASVPTGPEDRSRPPSIPDPDEPGISPETRQARLRLLLQRYEKGSRGSGR
jgi:hypothetical protein